MAPPATALATHMRRRSAMTDHRRSTIGPIEKQPRIHFFPFDLAEIVWPRPLLANARVSLL
jgi:hypothetical protein